MNLWAAGGTAIAAANNRIYAEAQQDPAGRRDGVRSHAALVEGEQEPSEGGRFAPLPDRPWGHFEGYQRPFPVGEMEDAGELSGGDGASAARMATTTPGSSPRSAEEEDFIEVRPGDTAMLLCSDGLSDHLTSHRIRAHPRRYAGDAAQMASSLVDAANQAGGRGQHHGGFVAGPAFRGRSAATRLRGLGVTRIRPRRLSPPPKKKKKKKSRAIPATVRPSMNGMATKK